MKAGGALLYEGKAKRVYSTDDPGLYLIEFKDDATAHNGLKRGTIRGKGAVNCQVSAVLFSRLASAGVPNHFVRLEGPDRMIVRKLDMVPLEVVVRNVIAGSLAKRLGIEEGTRPAFPIVEFYYKNDALGDPLVTEDHIAALAIAPQGVVSRLRDLALAVNRAIGPFLAGRGLQLVDFKLEFGRADGELVLGDEISPDTCRLWDSATGDRLDKDRFRRDMGGVEDAYEEVFRRVVGAEAPRDGDAQGA